MADQTSQNFNAAFAAGRVAGLAVAALTISIVAFVQLLGAEKAIVGLVLGTLAYRGASDASPQGRRLAIAAIAVSLVYLLVMITVVLFAGEDLLDALKALDQAS
ncbi:MAG: hypothetical protein GKR90_06230 [Pseudomonadales bacterium]|nr:hypothetical protein [Pseudomonadales bacterium]